MNEKNFQLGDINISLKDAHCGIGILGSLGSGKTVSVIKPLITQLFEKLSHSDDREETAKFGGLIIDETGDLTDFIIKEAKKHDREKDIIIININNKAFCMEDFLKEKNIEPQESTVLQKLYPSCVAEWSQTFDPKINTYKYNPLDPYQNAEENSYKITKVQKLLNRVSDGDNAYWEQNTQTAIKFFLQLLEVYKPKSEIGLQDLASFMLNDRKAEELCNTVEDKIHEKNVQKFINDKEYQQYCNAIYHTRNAWINLNPNTKYTLKTIITNMLGSIEYNKNLQEVFGSYTDFCFKDLANKGKIILFNGAGMDTSTRRLVGICLKKDFQLWQKRRCGSAAETYGLNTTRTLVFICDEYQAFATCSEDGDETFYGTSRSSRTLPIISAQSYNSLKCAIKNDEQTKALRQNISTWVFLRSCDAETCNLVESLSAGEFTAKDVNKLQTIAKTGISVSPYYSEAIVYNYQSTSELTKNSCYKTKLPHYYTKEIWKRKRKNYTELTSHLIQVQLTPNHAPFQKKKILKLLVGIVLFTLGAVLLKNGTTKPRH